MLQAPWRTRTLTPQTSQHQNLIAQLQIDPLGVYNNLHGRFLGMPQLDQPFPELFPVVESLMAQLSTEAILELASTNPAVDALRRMAQQSLRAVAIKSRQQLPYQETIRAIQSCVEFFDVCVRTVEAESLGDHVVGSEENPRERALAYYHRYRYLYYWHKLLHAMPYIFLIPTDQEFTAMQMMRFRCVPIFIIGVSHKKIYVDEFNQTPAEFLFHDANHARRQYDANERWFAKKGITSQEERVAIYRSSHFFSKQILDALEPAETDSEEEKALKKLMLIILFEITHEDAEPFLPDVICESLQRMEGFASTFEVPSIDPSTGFMDVTETTETGIATLAYVRAKLQQGFYDEINDANAEIVPLEYRTVTWIARAAHTLLGMIEELVVLPGVPTDEKGLPTEEYLLDRACSFGPEIVHQSPIKDEVYEARAGELREVNIKQYFTEQKLQAGETEAGLSAGLTRRDFPLPLAEIRLAVDVIVARNNGGSVQVLLSQRTEGLQKGSWSLPGAFVWQGEASLKTAERVLATKVGLEGPYTGLKQAYLADAPERDPRTRIASMVHILHLEEANLDAPSGNQQWFAIDQLPAMFIDHREIITSVFS